MTKVTELISGKTKSRSVVTWLAEQVLSINIPTLPVTEMEVKNTFQSFMTFSVYILKVFHSFLENKYVAKYIFHSLTFH